MSVHNQYLNHPDLSGHQPGPLIQVGAVFHIEVHVPPQIAQALSDQGKPIPAPVPGMGLIDTGATLTAVHQPALQSLGLNPVSTVELGTANGRVTQSMYPARIVIPTKGRVVDMPVVGVDLSGQQIQIDPPQPLIVLIGRDLLASWVMIWNGPSGCWTVAD